MRPAYRERLVLGAPSSLGVSCCCLLLGARRLARGVTLGHRPNDDWDFFPGASSASVESGHLVARPPLSADAADMVVGAVPSGCPPGENLAALQVATARHRRGSLS